MSYSDEVMSTTGLSLLAREMSAHGRVRCARKTWTCIRSEDFITVGGFRNPNFRNNRPGCTPTINPGDRYFEYLGESTAFESGTRYCAACAVAVWL